MAKTPEERKEYKRQWYLRNHERLLQRNRDYFIAHREENKARCRAKYAANKDEYHERGRAYRKTEAGRAARRLEKKNRREKHREKVLAEDKRHRERNRGRRVAYMLEYNRANGERLRGMMRGYYHAKPDEYRERKRKWDLANPGYDVKWRRQNPDAARAIAVKKNNKRRAIKKGAEIGTNRKATLARIREIKSPDVLPCHWCGTPTPKDKRHVDHIIPLSRGGPHDAENLCGSCPRCNCSKRNKLPHEFTPVTSPP